jgi:hypothetical protein
VTADLPVTVTDDETASLVVSTSSLTVAEGDDADWNTAQTVTVSAAEDADAADDEATLVHTASGGGYDSVTADVSVTVTDNETALHGEAVDRADGAGPGGQPDGSDGCRGGQFELHGGAVDAADGERDGGDQRPLGASRGRRART